MTLTPCRECGQQVSTEATTCPHCGVPSPVMTEKQRKEETYRQILREEQAKRHRSSEQKEAAYREALEQQKAQRAQRSGWGPIILAFVIVGGLLGYQVWSSDRPSTSSSQRQAEELEEAGAYTACQSFVKDRLRSPSTAKFPWGYTGYIDHLGGLKYRVRRHVDSQNAFGAEVRTEFTCTVEAPRFMDGSWRLLSLDLTER